VFLLLASFWTGGLAQNLIWDADPTLAGVQDGSGVWSTTTNTWWTGSANTIWNNSIPNGAIFGSGSDQGGTVVLGEHIVCANIRFNAPGAGNYTIVGDGFTLALTNRNIYATVNAVITAPITGVGITISHGAPNMPCGVLTLAGNNNFGGTLNIGQNANNEDNQGPANTTCAVRAMSNTALGNSTLQFNTQGNATSPRLEVVGGITLTNPITWQGRNNVTPAFVSYGGNNALAGPITLGAGGTQYRMSVHGAGSLTVGGNMTIQATGGRTIVLDGSGTGFYAGALTGGSAAAWSNIVVKAGLGTWTFSGNNSFVGSYGLSGGKLILDYSANNIAKLSSQGALYLSGGTLTLNGGSYVETVASNVIVAGDTKITRASGSSSLRLNRIFRHAGGTIDFETVGIADTDSENMNGILGGFATVNGSDWAVNTTGGNDGVIGIYTAYTDIPATGSTIPNNPTANVRLNSSGGGGNLTLAADVTTVNTLLQNTTVAATIETGGKILRLGLTGGILVPVGRQGLTIGTPTGGGSLTAGGVDNSAGEIIIINNSTNPVTINATIIDNGSAPVSVTKSGSGPLVLNGNNLHTGTNYIVCGSLVISSAANLGLGPVLINGGTLEVVGNVELQNPVMVGPVVGYGMGTIKVATNCTLTLYGEVSEAPFIGLANAGGLVKTGPGTLVLASQGNTYRLGTVIKEGKLRITTGAVLGGFGGPTRNGTFSCYQPENIVIDGGILEADATLTLESTRGIRIGPVEGAGTGTISVTDWNQLTFNGQISDNWGGTGTFVKDGNGTLTLGGSVNDYSGDTIIKAGTLQVNNPRAIPSGPGKGNVIVNPGATLDLNGISLSINGLSGSGEVTSSVGGGTLKLGFNDANSTFTGSISGYGLTLAKFGAGTVTLSGPLSISGSLIVNKGTLRLTGNASPFSVTNIEVASGGILDVSGLSGGLTLGTGASLNGKGTIQGNVSDSFGAFINPGGTNTAGMLKIAGNLTLNGYSTFAFDLSADSVSGANDEVEVSGALIVNGPVTINLNYLQGVPSVGAYTLFKYGSFSGNVGNFQVPPGFVVTNNTAVKEIQLVVARVPAVLTWVGDGVANVWDTGITANWVQNGAPAYFYAGDHVIFNDSGNNQPPINISGVVYPGSITVSASKDYTFTGGMIGYGLLTKSGTGTLILDNDNIFSGVLISGGVLQVGNGGTTGNIAGGAITNNSKLIFNRTDTLGVTNPITGSGSVYQSGYGDLMLSGSNSYTGPTIVEAGVLHPRHPYALGATNSGTFVTNGGLLYIDANIDIVEEPLILSGLALRKGGAGRTIYSGPITLVGDAQFHVDGNATLVLSNEAGVNGASVNANLTLTGDNGSLGVIAGPLNLRNGLLTKDGPGAWKLAAANNFGGFAGVYGGELIIGHPKALGSLTTIPVYTSTGGAGITGTRITLADGTALSNVWVGLPSDASTRSALFSRGTGGVTNIWAGPIAFTGSEGTINFGTEPGAVFMIAGPITNQIFSGVLILRGSGGGGTSGSGCTGIIAAPILLNSQMTRVSIDDGATWIFAVGGHSFATNNITSGTVKLGVHNALPVNCTLVFGLGGVADETFDLAGFNQQLAAIVTLSTTPRIIGNSSTDSDSVLTLAGPNTSLFGGVIRDTIGAGTRRVSLALRDGAYLTLTNVNTYSGDTIIGSGCTLALAGLGAISNSLNVILENGAALDVTGRVDTTLTLAPAQTLKGNGTLNINGSLINQGTIELKVAKSGTVITADKLQVSGQLNYGGKLHVVLSGDALTAGDSIKLFEAASYAGSFVEISPAVPGPGLAWDTSTLAQDGVLRVVTGVAPAIRISSVSMITTNIVISVSNGLAGARCHLLSSTNITLPVQNWQRIQTNVFNPDGSLVITNAVIPGEPYRFYRLQFE